jgi:hypothetical protein
MVSRQGAPTIFARREFAFYVRRLAGAVFLLECFALGCGAEDIRAPPLTGDSNPPSSEPLPEASTPPEASMRPETPLPPEGSTVDDADADGGVDAVISADGSGCGAVIEQQPVALGAHLPDCKYIDYATNPPSSGDHYATWIAHKTYSVPIPRGYVVHNLEHAATVIWYNCPGGCEAEIAAAQKFIDELPVDPLCPTSGPKRRVLMVPDPQLTTKWAASTWGWTLRAACFDRAAFAEFVSLHYGQGPENFCSDGIDLVDADGAVRVPPGCGTPSFDAGTSAR